jgi:hypothetical protein
MKKTKIFNNQLLLESELKNKHFVNLNRKKNIKLKLIFSKSKFS